MKENVFIIADDHPLIIEGFEKVLKVLYSDAEVYKAQNKKELDDILGKVNHAILFLDIVFGKDDARHFIKELIAAHQDVKVIAISTLSDQMTIDTMLSEGAKAYLVKSDAKEIIAACIKSVKEGTVYLSPSVKQHYRNSHKIVLSKREKEVLRLILDECTNKEIAEKLNLSEKTIEHHRSSLLIKFEAKNIAGLVKQALLQGYL